MTCREEVAVRSCHGELRFKQKLLSFVELTLFYFVILFYCFYFIYFDFILLYNSNFC